MDLVRTLGVAIDPTGAKAGGAQASDAFKNVGKAARDTEKATERVDRQLVMVGKTMATTKRSGDALRETLAHQTTALQRMALMATAANSSLRTLAGTMLQLSSGSALLAGGGAGGGGGRQIINVTGTGGPSPQLLLQTSSAARAAAQSLGLLYRQGMLTAAMWQAMINGAGRAAGAVRGAGSSMLGAAGRFGAQYGLIGGAVGGALFTNSVLQTGMSGDRVRNMLGASTGSNDIASREIAFVKDMTARLGLEFQSTSESYAKFVSVGKLSQLTFAEIRDTFEGVANASAVMGLSAEDNAGVTKALTDMLSKGTIQAEELKGQLGDRLPGAIALMAKTLNVGTQELMKMSERGELMATDVLPKFGRALKEQFGPDAARNAKTTTGAINELKNAWTDFKQELIDAGLVDALKKVMGFIVTVVRELGNIAGFIKKAFNDIKGEFGDGMLGKLAAGLGAIPLGVGDWANSGVKWGTPKPAGNFALPASEVYNRMPPFVVRPTATDSFRSGLVNAADDLTKMGTYTRADPVTGNIEKRMGQLERAGEETTQALAGNFTDFFSGMVTEGGSAIDRLRNMFSSLARDVASIFARRTIAEPIAGWLASGFGALLGGSVGGTTAAAVKHAGGIVGVGGLSRFVNPSLFAGAPRLHSGLAPDEFPAILQRGEEVIPKGGTGRRGDTVNITVNVDGGKGGSPEQNQRLGSEVARQIEMMMDARIARATGPRGILSTRFA